MSTKTKNLQQCLSKHPVIYAAYAKCGVWYDAIMELSEEITKNPDDPVLKRGQKKYLSTRGISFFFNKGLNL